MEDESIKLKSNGNGMKTTCFREEGDDRRNKEGSKPMEMRDLELIRNNTKRGLGDLDICGYAKIETNEKSI